MCDAVEGAGDSGRIGDREREREAALAGERERDRDSSKSRERCAMSVNQNAYSYAGYNFQSECDCSSVKSLRIMYHSPLHGVCVSVYYCTTSHVWMCTHVLSPSFFFSLQRPLMSLSTVRLLGLPALYLGVQ